MYVDVQVCTDICSQEEGLPQSTRNQISSMVLGKTCLNRGNQGIYGMNLAKPCTYHMHKTLCRARQWFVRGPLTASLHSRSLQGRASLCFSRANQFVRPVHIASSSQLLLLAQTLCRPYAHHQE